MTSQRVSGSECLLGVVDHVVEPAVIAEIFHAIASGVFRPLGVMLASCIDRYRGLRVNTSLPLSAIIVIALL